ncbi:MAG: iron complex outerrane recepter protein [Sphingomonadales bacterium]|jgi:TonB-dependent receptor|nr:iron complex outerrane recepter protein [Sphingomonadales bacterium]
MRVKTFVLCSTSAIGFALATTPAQAQDTPPPPPDTTAQGQPAPTASGTDTGDNGETIVVTGLRRSLQSAQNIKRNAPQQIDAIVANDIGKLPDIAVSDTAARIPGVQVERGGGEAGRVLIRGLPDFETTYNGREIFTAETRLVALQDFPSANIAALEVYKTTTADLVEAGLAGLVNVRSRRPFDFSGFQAAGSIWALYPKESGKVTPNGNLLISDRWSTGAGDFGALINFSYTELQYLDSERSNTDFIADPTINGQHVRLPDIQRVFYGSGDRSRPSINGALQWRPSRGLEFYLEGLWQGFRNKVSDRIVAVPLWGGAQYTNIALRPGTNLVESGTVVNPFRPDGFQGGTFNKTDTYQFAGGGSYENGGFRIAGDIAHTSTTFTGSTASVDYAFANPQTVNFFLDTAGGDHGPEFSFQNFDPANPANYIYRGFYEEHQVAHGADWQARLDVSYEPNVSFIKKIEAGVRYTDRDAHREFGNRYWNFEGNRIPITQVPLDYELFHSGFRGSDIQSFRDWLAPTYSSIRANLVAMRDFNMHLGGTQFGPNTDTTVTPDPTQTYDANEKTSAAYAQLRYGFGSSIQVDGIIGLRAVHTKLAIDGTSTLAGIQTPVAARNSYTDWLPNASMRIRFTPQVQLRLSATQTRTKPTFAQLNPSASLGSPPSNCNPTGDPYSCARSGGGGNPFLKPLESNNYDASLEYYFSRTGFASVALFRRDMKNFIDTRQFRYIDPALGPVIVTGPVNINKVQIDGAEAQFTTFFDFGPAWLRSFGVQANATYLNPKPDLTNVSKWAYNLAAFYEHGGLSARLSYNWRGKFTTTTQNRGDDQYYEIARPVSRLDLSMSYNVTGNATVFFDWTNMLGKPFRSDLYSARGGAPLATYPRFVRYEETVFSGGIRFRF